VVKAKSSVKAPASSGPISIELLSEARVLELHHALVAFSAGTEAPVKDLGLRDELLLEAAVSRQFQSTGLLMEGSDPREKTAALLQGLIDELPFYDGNAQTALLTTLMHLDINGFAPNQVSHDDLYRLISALISHETSELPLKGAKAASRKAGVKATQEDELSRVFQWLIANSRWADHREYPLPLPELKRLLNSLDADLADPVAGQIEVIKADAQTEKRFLGLGSKTVSRMIPVMKFPDPGEDGLVSANILRDIQKALGLSTQDDKPIYDWPAKVQSFLRKYQTLWPRLAKL
jgi:prophage maintenance system killer protein